jgi:hypothetical protein
MMIRGIERRKIFRDDDDRQDMLDRLATLLPETGTVCYAWAFLDNHAHFLFRSGPRGIAVGAAFRYDGRRGQLRSPPQRRTCI